MQTKFSDTVATNPVDLLTRYFRSGVEDLTPIDRGVWAQAYSFRHEGTALVLRLSAQGDDFAKDLFAVRYASSTLPIPRVLTVGEVDGTHYAISERVHGSFLDHISAREMRATFPALLVMFDALRDADVSGSTGYGLWDGHGVGAQRTWHEALMAVADDKLPDRTYGWPGHLRHFPDASDALHEGLDALDALLSNCPEERHLIHSDTLHRNILVRNNTISGAIDWGCSMYGDFLYDLAWIAFSAPMHRNFRDIDIQAEAEHHYRAIGLEVRHFTERLACCYAHIGVRLIAYNAYRNNAHALSGVAARMRQLLHS